MKPCDHKTDLFSKLRSATLATFLVSYILLMSSQIITLKKKMKKKNLDIRQENSCLDHQNTRLRANCCRQWRISSGQPRMVSRHAQDLNDSTARLFVSLWSSKLLVVLAMGEKCTYKDDKCSCNKKVSSMWPLKYRNETHHQSLKKKKKEEDIRYCTINWMY